MRTFWLAMAISAASLLPGCGGDEALNYTCDEPKLYQEVRPAKRIEVPEGLDPLDEYREMPIPEPETVAQRPDGSRCIELPPTTVAE